MIIGLYILVGLIIGGISSILGIGGGVLLVPILMWLFPHNDQRHAAGISLAVLAVPVVLPAVWQYYTRGYITSGDLLVALWLALGFGCGFFTGPFLLDYISVPQLRLWFGLLLIYIAIRFLIASDSEFTQALFGLIAMFFALVAYYSLRALGRKYSPKPSLAESIRSIPKNGQPESEYYI